MTDQTPAQPRTTDPADISDPADTVDHAGVVSQTFAAAVAEQNLARSLLAAAVNGGVDRWADVQYFNGIGAPSQILAEGVELANGSTWSVNLQDIAHAVTKLVKHPERCRDSAAAAHLSAHDLRAVSEILGDARDFGAHDLPAIRARATDPDFSLVIADVVVRVAVASAAVTADARRRVEPRTTNRTEGA